MKIARILAAIITFVASSAVWAHGTADGENAAKRSISPDQKAFGREGDPGRVTRTVHVEMSDVMRFSPAEITIKQGETVRFVAKNSGKVLHEMVLGTMHELKAHAALMKKFPGMEHDEPYMAHVGPGKTGRIVWQFTQPGEYHYGCLVPGHFEAGMIGKVTVK